MRITLCGSARFEKEFRIWDGWLTLAGHVVYNLAIYPSEQVEKNWYTDEQKAMLDAVHKQKIDNSDAIVVLNYGAYVGESTASEILHAKATGKSRYYVSIPPDIDQDGKRICPYNYCTTRGLIDTQPPCAVCYQ